MRLRLALAGLFCLFIGASCQKHADLTVERYDQQLFANPSADGVRAFLKAHPGAAQLYFNANSAGTDTAYVRELTNRIGNPALAQFDRQLQNQFGDLTDLRSQLAEAFASIQREFPDFKPPRVATIVTGFMGPDIVLSDSLIVIGLDYFGGPKATYRPRGPEFPQYILRRYQIEYLVPAIVFALSDRYNRTNRADQTLLADMVYYGKGYVFTKTMLPDVADSLVIGYSDKQLTDTFNAQDIVWAHFIDNQLLYQTNPAIKAKYLSERPFTAEIGQACPGAIGRWLGWRVVGRYHDTHGDVSIANLMRDPDARQIFEQSGYKGQKD